MKKRVTSVFILWGIFACIVSVPQATSAGSGGTGAISGRVTDASDVPLPGINVRPYYWVGPYDNWAPYGPGTTTDVNGVYLISGLFANPYRVEFSDSSGDYLGETYDDYSGSAYEGGTSFSVNGNTVSNINASLTRAARITGIVYGPSGINPLSNISVNVYSWDGGSWYPENNYAGTDAAGRYTITGLRAGTYRVEFADPAKNYLGETYDDFPDSAYVGGSNIVVAEAGAASNINASLSLASSISGSVYGPGGTNPLPGIVAYLYKQETFGWFPASVYDATDSEGRYEIKGLGAGTYRVFFDDFYGDYLDETYDNFPGEPSDGGSNIVLGASSAISNINASLSAASFITGTVWGPSGTNPLSDIEVNAYMWVGTNWVNVQTYYTFDGYYAIGSLRAGIYRIQFQDIFGNYYAGETYDNFPGDPADGGSNIVVDASSIVSNINASLAVGARITGTVYDSTGTTPLSGMSVEAYLWSGSSWNYAGGGYIYTDFNGQYSLDGLKAGTYRVIFYDPSAEYLSETFDNFPGDYADGGSNIVVAESSVVSNINASLTKGSKITGIVYDQTGTIRLPGIYATAYYWTGSLWSYAALAITDANGEYEIDGLQAGNYRLQFDDSGSVYSTRVYLNATTLNSGTDIVVPVSTTVPGINVNMAVKGVGSGPSLEPVIFMLLLNSSSTNQ